MAWHLTSYLRIDTSALVADGIPAKAEEKVSSHMTYTNSVEAFCNEGAIEVCYGIDGDIANRDGLMSVTSSFERFLQHACSRKLVSHMNMLVESFGPAETSFGSTVTLTGQASIDGNTLEMVVEFRLNRRLNERQTRQIKAYITSHLMGDIFECFTDMIGELIFEGSLHMADDLVLSGA